MAANRNEFLTLVQQAADEKLCTEPFCTTCGNKEFRQSLSQIAGDQGWGVCEALTNLRIKELLQLQNWDNCLRLAFMTMPWPGQHEKVIQAWVPQIDHNLKFADFVLFYIVRTLPFGRSAGKGWIDRCLLMAIATRDESLVESLLWTLGRDAIEHDELMQVASELSRGSFKVRRALAETGCG